ncbi:unnamed protein product [Laminaria digitata]
MVNVHNRRCSRGSCTRQPSFNVEGMKTAAYCKQHAGAGMGNVHGRRCVHVSCTKWPAWGVLTDGAATACPGHKSNLFGGPVINFKAMCKVVGCRNVSRWGLDGKQPTHCRDHGPLMDGLMCTIGTAGNKGTCPSPSYGAVRGPSVHFKTECLF